MISSRHDWKNVDCVCHKNSKWVWSGNTTITNCRLETEGQWVRASPASLCFGPWARHIYPSLVLVQPRKTHPCLTERFLMGRKESNQTKTNCRQTHGIMRKSHTIIMRHKEDKQSKATSSLFPIKMIAKLEWTQSYAQQNIEKLQNPTMRVTINNESTTWKISLYFAKCVTLCKLRLLLFLLFTTEPPP